MIIKKYQGKNEEEATQIARKELGDGVVVMNVKLVKQKGLFRFLKSQVTEVTVALEEESERSAAKLEAINRAMLTPREPSNNDVHSQFSLFTPDENDSDVNKGMKSKAIEDKLDSLQILLEKQLKKPEEENSIKKEKEIVKEEPNESIAFMQLIYNTLIENEVDEIYANQIIDEIDKVCKPNSPMDYILSNVYQRLILKFGNPTGITPSNEGTKVIFFVGPTGVGKTTTIAKIASKFSVDEKKKVALLTADTYRIAAAEQLRTYANILDVPFRVIYTKDELTQGLADFKDCDYILVDTAGHSHKNEAQKESMYEMINAIDDKMDKEIFLVLSATTKYRDLLFIADSYDKIKSLKLIFTKLDETTTLGNLFNLRMHTKAPIAYVTCGQNVPDDIENFNPQGTVKLLLGGKR